MFFCDIDILIIIFLLFDWIFCGVLMLRYMIGYCIVILCCVVVLERVFLVCVCIVNMLVVLYEWFIDRVRRFFLLILERLNFEELFLREIFKFIRVFWVSRILIVSVWLILIGDNLGIFRFFIVCNMYGFLKYWICVDDILLNVVIEMFWVFVEVNVCVMFVVLKIFLVWFFLNC